MATILPALEFEAVGALFDQALLAHPRVAGVEDSGRWQVVMMEFAELIRAEHNGWLAKLDSRRAGRRDVETA